MTTGALAAAYKERIERIVSGLDFSAACAARPKGEDAVVAERLRSAAFYLLWGIVRTPGWTAEADGLYVTNDCGALTLTDPRSNQRSSEGGEDGKSQTDVPLV